MKDSHNNERLLLHDTGSSSERIIIFATERSLQYLKKRNVVYGWKFWFGSQVFFAAVRNKSEKENFCVTAAYCLLQRKSQDTYEELFKISVEECASRYIYLDPKIVHLDFEKACINALKNTFGSHISIKGASTN